MVLFLILDLQAGLGTYTIARLVKQVLYRVIATMTRAGLRFS